MRKIVLLLTLMVIASIFVVACSGETYKPVAINEDTDHCEICNMAIKDDQYATQIITKEGRSLKFDDLGCLHEWQVENGTETIGATFVRDYNSLQWIKYEKAYYVYDASNQTPMAYGVISFEKQEDAKQYVTEHSAGTVMTATELAGHSWEVNHDAHHDHDHGTTEEHMDMSDDTMHTESDAAHSSH